MFLCFLFISFALTDFSIFFLYNIYRDRQTKLIQDITKRVERFEIQKERDAMLEKNCHVQLAAVMSECVSGEHRYTFFFRCDPFLCSRF